MRRRFHREFQVLNRFQHPRLVRTYTWCFAEERPYFTMDYLPGKTLEKIIADQALLAQFLTLHFFALVQQLAYDIPAGMDLPVSDVKDAIEGAGFDFKKFPCRPCSRASRWICHVRHRSIGLVHTKSTASTFFKDFCYRRVYLSDQKVPISVPRVRNVLADEEVSLQTYHHFQHPRKMDEGLLLRMIKGIATRAYQACAEAIPEAFGLSSSTVDLSSVLFIYYLLSCALSRDKSVSVEENVALPCDFFYTSCRFFRVYLARLECADFAKHICQCFFRGVCRQARIEIPPHTFQRTSLRMNKLRHKFMRRVLHQIFQPGSRST